MALSKQIGTVYGVPASYWKITDISLDSLGGSARVVISGFYDQSTRENGAQPLKTFEYTASGEDILTYFPTGLEVAQVYGFVKAQSDFIFAEDC